MMNRLSRHATFGVYQLAIALGILLWPIAAISNRVGISIPYHRLIDRIEQMHERRTN